MMRFSSLNLALPVFSSVRSPAAASHAADPLRSEWVAEQIGEKLSAKDQFITQFQRLSVPLRNDDATFERVFNLIEPVDDAGRRGSYAGWITRSALHAAAERADARGLESLLLFFQKGGSIRDLESRTARLLPPFPDVPRDFSFPKTLWARVNPLWGWRRHRRESLVRSEDPLRYLKLAELRDRGLRLFAGDAKRLLGRPQQSAYLRDDDVKFLSERILQKGPGWTTEASRSRYDDVCDSIAAFLPSAGDPFQRLWPPQVRGALSVLPDDRSAAVAGRIQKEYTLLLSPPGKFESEVRKRRRLEGHKAITDPSTQNAVYLPRSQHGPATLFVRSMPIGISGNVGPSCVLFEIMATVVHEDDHHVRMKEVSYSGTAEEKFAFEFRGHGVEFLWRAQHGDSGPLRRLTVENPLGFGLAFRDYYEVHYA